MDMQVLCMDMKHMKFNHKKGTCDFMRYFQKYYLLSIFSVAVSKGGYFQYLKCKRNHRLEKLCEMNEPKFNGKLISIHPCNKLAMIFTVYMKRDKN